MGFWRVLGLVLLVMALALLSGAGGAWWVLHNGMAVVPLHDQALQAQLPADLPVSVSVLQGRGPGADDDSRGIPVRLNETLKLNVDFDTEVPLSLTVRYQGTIPVNTMVPIDTTMDTRVLGIPMTLPINGEIPLDLDLPVDLTIPISQPVRLAFTAPITARVDQVVHIPLQAELETRIHFGDTPLPLRLQHSVLALPLDRLWLTGKAADDWRLGPLRHNEKTPDGTEPAGGELQGFTE